MGSQQEQVRTFRVLSTLRVMVPALVASVAALAVVFITLDAETYWIIGVIAAVLLVGLGLGAWLTTRARLEISPQQITYYAAGYLVRSSWNNITGWEKRVIGASEIDCLILREPGMEMGMWMRVGAKLMPAASIAGALSGRPINTNSLEDSAYLIPVGMFDRTWRIGEIGRLIERYAPHVFQDNPTSTD